MRKELKLYIIIGFLLLLMILEFVFFGGLELLFKLAEEINSAGLNFIEFINNLIGRRK